MCCEQLVAAYIPSTLSFSVLFNATKLDACTGSRVTPAAPRRVPARKGTDTGASFPRAPSREPASCGQLRGQRGHPRTLAVHRLLELARRGARRCLLARKSIDAHAHDSAAEVQAPPHELLNDIGVRTATRAEHAAR